MSIEAWLLFCATEAVLCFTPGPAVLLVVSIALARGAAAGLGASFGILAANAAYFALSATSLGAILVASWELFVLIKWLGAAYLVYMGAKMLWNAGGRGFAANAAAELTRARSFAQGFFTQAANPKALVFFTAILPQFIDPRGAVAYQVTILGVSSILIELAVLGIYVTACRSARAWMHAPRLAAPLERLGGTFLIIAGVRLAAIRSA
jgi:threonine/homoserine/homoserine lactone efflux protein